MPSFTGRTVASLIVSNVEGVSVGDVVSRLWESRRAGDHFPAWLAEAGLDLHSALEVQLGLLSRAWEGGERLAGWKVGLTSPRARAMIGADERPFGYVLESGVVPSGGHVPFASLSRGAIEAELCLTMGARLQGAVTPEQARAAVRTVSAGFEVNERRPGSARPDFTMMVTDRMSQRAIVCGTGVPAEQVGDVGAIEVTLLRNGQQRWRGVSRDELDDHWASLARLAAVLGEHGVALEPGQRVITGAFCRFDAALGDTWKAIYRGIGEVEVSFT
jgi:2-keto-4-pentenoate hydratase